MKTEDIISQLGNIWDNTYWFSRMLISGDKYGGIGKDNKLLSIISGTLRLIKVENKKGINTLSLQKQALRNILTERYLKAKSINQRVNKFLVDIEDIISTSEDMEVFIFTCECIMIPINQAIANIPSDDKQFTLSIAKSYLDIQGELGLATVINLWDDLGTKGCLTVERSEVVKAFTYLRIFLNKKLKIAEEDKDIVLTTFAQEFERRAGQKRKHRAGGSVEDVTSFILDYYKIKSASKPEHFQADIEVDKWIKTNDGWIIGISCKRTLRERWKQVSSAESTILDKFKIKYIYHVITFDEDLSDDKITLLGGLRHKFYLPDGSRRLKYAQKHIGLKNYVRPISKFVSDIRFEINN